MHGLQGAERAVQFPQGLQRFADLPMKVDYIEPADMDHPERACSAILKYIGADEDTKATVWELANVRRNRPAQKGTKLTKKQLQHKYHIAAADLRRVNLYLDI